MWIEQKPNGILMHCQIQARASRSEITGLHGDPPCLRIRLAAPPVEGAANDELILFLSRLLKIPRRQISIASGHTSKYKSVFLSDLQDANKLARALVPSKTFR